MGLCTSKANYTPVPADPLVPSKISAQQEAKAYEAAFERDFRIFVDAYSDRANTVLASLLREYFRPSINLPTPDDTNNYVVRVNKTDLKIRFTKKLRAYGGIGEFQSVHKYYTPNDECRFCQGIMSMFPAAAKIVKVAFEEAGYAWEETASQITITLESQ
jgi:hypothetical protein